MTQLSVTEKIGISIDTLRRVENGLVTPKFETLVKLSLVYKIDIIKLLGDYSKIPSLVEYYDQVQAAIDNTDINKIAHIEALLEKDFKAFIEIGIINNLEIYQFNLFCRASRNFLENTNTTLKTACDIIIKAMKLTEVDFNVEHIHSFTLSYIETRFLHLYALSKRRLKDYNDSLKIILYLIEKNDNSLHDDNTIKNQILLYFSSSYTYFEKKDYKNSLYYADSGIHIGRKYCRLNELHLLFYRKGIAEFHMNNPDYKRSLDISITLLDIINPKLSNRYRKITLNQYGIIL